MPTSIKDAVLETLGDDRIRRVNFQYGPCLVYPSGYGDVAKLVRDGHIQFRVSEDANAHYGVSTEPGQTHYMHIPASMVEQGRGGRLMLRGDRLGSAGRGTIVHESTHALQDYQRNTQLTPSMAEGAAYVAGWMARLLWGEPRLSASVDPGMTSHTYARWIAGRLLDREIVYLVPDRDISQLNRRVLIGAPHFYVFNGI